MYNPEMIVIHGLYTAAGDDFLKTLRETGPFRYVK